MARAEQLISAVQQSQFLHLDSLIHLFVGGSELHGAKVKDTDDLDIYGVYLEPPQLLLGLDKQDFYVWSTAGNERRNGPDDVDVCLYSLRKWAGLTAKGNPTALHFLFSRNYALKPQPWDVVLKHRDVFLSRQASMQFRGFAEAQVRRLQGIGTGKKGQRHELIAAHGYDIKAAMHVIRLLNEGIELMRSGTITLPRPEKDLLITIRTGNYGSLERVADSREYSVPRTRRGCGEERATGESRQRANLEIGEQNVSSLLERSSRNGGMPAMTALFRPVGLHELALIWDSGMREFRPRLPHQPIFYPVANIEYATQIARDWNTKDSSFAGYVTKFGISGSYLTEFEPHTVGSATHVEYWIPGEQLLEFNASIEGRIIVESGFFGPGFKGFVPDSFGLKGKDAAEQFIAMAKTWDYSRMDFVCEVSTNRKAVYLNFLFWAQFDFTPFGIDTKQRDATVTHVRESWEFNRIEIPLPHCD